MQIGKILVPEVYTEAHFRVMRMLINFPRYIRDLARLKGIPEQFLSAVVHRFIAARKARDQLGGFAPASPMHEITQVETQIEHADRLLAKRVVERAAEDFSNGVLERHILMRCFGVAGDRVREKMRRMRRSSRSIRISP